MDSIEKFIEKIVDMRVDEKLAKIKQDRSQLLEEDRYLTVTEAAKFIKVSTRTIYNYLDSGVFNRIYFGGSVRIDKLEIIEFANRQKSA